MSLSTSEKENRSRSATGRMAAVQEMAALQRMLFEVEREFVRTATTLIYRVGDIELKYLLCQHIWESAGHARFLRERGRELSGFGKGESVRVSFRNIFEEAIRPEDPEIALAGFYRILKPAILSAYREYLSVTHHLADWPSRNLVEEFILDEERHALEMQPFLKEVPSGEWETHLQAALSAIGAWLGENPKTTLPENFNWSHEEAAYRHPDTCNRGKYPVCSSAFGTGYSSDLACFS